MVPIRLHDANEYWNVFQKWNCASHKNGSHSITSMTEWSSVIYLENINPTRISFLSNDHFSRWQYIVVIGRVSCESKSPLFVGVARRSVGRYWKYNLSSFCVTKCRLNCCISVNITFMCGPIHEWWRARDRCSCWYERSTFCSWIRIP